MGDERDQLPISLHQSQQTWPPPRRPLLAAPPPPVLSARQAPRLLSGPPGRRRSLCAQKLRGYPSRSATRRAACCSHLAARRSTSRARSAVEANAPRGRVSRLALAMSNGVDGWVGPEQMVVYWLVGCRISCSRPADPPRSRPSRRCAPLGAPARANEGGLAGGRCG